MPRTPESSEDHVLAERIAEEVFTAPNMVLQRELEALARSYLELKAIFDSAERFAAEHGLPALLDHLGLDGLGNEVNALVAERDGLLGVLRTLDLLTQDPPANGATQAALEAINREIRAALAAQEEQ